MGKNRRLTNRQKPAVAGHSSGWPAGAGQGEAETGATSPDQVAAAESAVKNWRRAAEAAGIVLVLATVAFSLIASWRRWNAPVTDFGRELYTPWRLSQGAVLYRDVDEIYGPFSQYFNAAVFRVFGVGFMTLITANLCVFGVILASAYALFRRAWGALGAVAACLVFSAVFAFSQFQVQSNSNFAAPYAHEVTHGFLVCLLLALVLIRWLERPALAWAAGAGLLYGLTWVIKPEFILAGGVMIVVAAALRLRRSGKIAWPEGLLFGAAVLLPTVAFWGWFAQFMPAADAARGAGRAWLSLVSRSDMVAAPVQRAFMGLDTPGTRLWQHLEATFVALMIIALLGSLAWGALEEGKRVERAVWLVVASLVAIGCGFLVAPDTVGRCFLGLNLAYLGVTGARIWRSAGPGDPAWRSAAGPRLLVVALAAAMMARMALNGRILQYGFYQAALAAMAVTAILCVEVAEWLPARRGRTMVAGALFGLFLLSGTSRLVLVSRRMLAAQTQQVGSGPERFFFFPGNVDGTGLFVDRLLEPLRRAPKDSTLLVLPEGEMLNYLARLPSPLPQFQYYTFTTAGGREQAVVEALERHPPDRVALMSLDLREYGIAWYGEREGEGGRLVEWLRRNYVVTDQVGGDPRIHGHVGAVLLQRVPNVPASPATIAR